MCVCAHNSWLIRPDMSDMKPATLRLFSFLFSGMFSRTLVHLLIRRWGEKRVSAADALLAEALPHG
jgi:hypothetical protein